MTGSRSRRPIPKTPRCFLNFVIALHEALGVDLPEVDYPKLVTLDGCVGYLGEATARRP